MADVLLLREYNLYNKPQGGIGCDDHLRQFPREGRHHIGRRQREKRQAETLRRCRKFTAAALLLPGDHLGYPFKGANHQSFLRARWF
jgi:hypothetical protein